MACDVETMANEIICGDCLEVMAGWPADSVDTVITDPPYGLKFMGHGWDHGVPGVPYWQEVLRVAKPGAFLLAFGGTRTWHRLAVAIEDAGWELRDTMMWLHGQGFPKNMDLSKALDKEAGAEREVVGRAIGRGSNSGSGTYGWSDASDKSDRTGYDATLPATPAAEKWDGWGTALKPAAEYIICATKPLTLTQVTGILARKIGGAICQLPLLVKRAESSSTSSPSVPAGASDSVAWRAVERCSTVADLFAVMGTLPLESMAPIPTSLSIGVSWLSILGEVLSAQSTFTTEMVTSLTTDLKILNSYPWLNTPACLMEAESCQRGTESNV